MYNTANKQEILQEAVSQLVRELQRLNVNIPVAWVVPTTINSWALATEQKRENIREDQMEEFWILYRNAGIQNAVSFVLDGTAFTVDRVQESYDGVHYPLSVYDGGAQILANAFDWLLLDRDDVDDPFTAPKPVGMNSPYLGMAMLACVFIGLSCCDGFMGVSYFAAFVVPSVAPR